MIPHLRRLSFGFLQPVRFPNLERLSHNLHAVRNLRGFWNHSPRSSVRRSHVRASAILKILARLALVLHFCHSWPISRCCLLLRLLWLAHEHIEDSSNGLLSHLVLLEDLGLSNAASLSVQIRRLFFLFSLMSASMYCAICCATEPLFAMFCSWFWRTFATSW